eukprot:285381_1
MTDGTFDVLLNIEIKLQIEIDENDAEYVEKTAANNKLQQDIANFETDVVTLALSVAQTGELYISIQVVLDINGNVANTKTKGGKKVNSRDYTNKGILEQPSVNINGEGIIVANGFSATFINIEFDIAISASQKSGFKQLDDSNTRRRMLSEKKKKKYKSKSGVLTINLYESGSSRRRRMLTETDTNRRRLISDNKLDFNASSCFPYLISIDVQNETVVDETNNDDWSLNDVGIFPSCRYWNGEVAEWDPQGCFVYNISNVTVICACIHLTTFQISAEDFVPQANIITIYDLRDVTPKNLIKYPTVWIVFICFLGIFVVIGYLNPNKGNEGRSIVAYEDIIYNDTRSDKMKDDYTGKQVTAYKLYTPNPDKLGHGMRVMSNNAKCKMCKLHWNLFTIQVRNDHTLLSVFQRTGGTNFSSKQRLGCFFLYVSTIMVCTGMFYGLDQSTPIQDTFASFTISLCGTLPVLVVRKLFQKSKPEQVKSTRHSHLELEKPKTIRDELQVIDDEEKESSNEEGVDDTNTTVNGNEMAMDIRSFMAENGEITVADFNKHLEKIYDKENEQQKIRAVSDIRMILFDSLFPLPHYCKRIAWILLILLSIGACITAIVYGLQFDTEYSNHGFDKKQKNYDLYKNNQCWNTTLKLEIESKLTKEWFTKRNNQRKLDDESSFGGNDSKSWLLSIAQSLLTSLILWQPLSVYIVTWIKIWMFSWHLKLALGPSNIILLCKRCCCGYDTVLDTVVQDNNNQNNGQKSMMQMLSRVLSVKNTKYNTIGRNDTQHRRSHKIKDVVAHKNRPVDIISFLGNEVWIIDDTLTTNTNTDVMLSVRNEQELDYVKVKQDNDSCNEELELQQIVNDSNESDDKQSNDSHDDLDEIEVRK